MDPKRKSNIFNFIALIVIVGAGCFAYAELADSAEPACLSPRNTNSILCRGK